MPDLTVKRGDDFPPLQAVLSDINGPINLSNASSVQLLMKGAVSGVSGPMTIGSAVAGYVTYNWRASDLAFIDTYQVEFEISWASTVGASPATQTVPSGTNGQAVYNSIVTVADLYPQLGP